MEGGTERCTDGGVLIGEVCEWIDREVGSGQVLMDG